MPLETSITGDDLDAFKERKQAQWARVMGVIPGLQMIQSGEKGTQFVISNGTEMVIYGQLPHVVLEQTGSRKNPVMKAVPNERKPLERRSIDFDDAAIDQIISVWAAGDTAASIIRGFATL